MTDTTTIDGDNPVIVRFDDQIDVSHVLAHTDDAWTLHLTRRAVLMLGDSDYVKPTTAAEAVARWSFEREFEALPAEGGRLTLDDAGATWARRLARHLFDERRGEQPGELALELIDLGALALDLDPVLPPAPAISGAQR